ncbi:MAG: radical SAM protein [Defluviitaleaceae bacterium]|nr:radical SAM protein [Defluviitaleaceae bacterium]
MTNKIKAKNIIVKSNLPAADYVINPYVGCTHACTYCYAVFMNRFYGINKEWGSFAYEKEFPKIANIQKYEGKKVLLSSVTDPYQHLEKKTKLTRSIITEFVNSKVELEILTKSPLVLRDIDVIKEIPKATVGISMSLVDDTICKTIEKGCANYEARLETLKTLKKEGIKTYAFISPIFPYLTNYAKIIRDVKDVADEIFCENLNLRGKYKTSILQTIGNVAPEHYGEYLKIYSDKIYYYEFWEDIKTNIENIAIEEAVRDKIRFFFYHGKES